MTNTLYRKGTDGPFLKENGMGNISKCFKQLHQNKKIEFFLKCSNKTDDLKYNRSKVTSWFMLVCKNDLDIRVIGKQRDRRPD